MRMSLQHNPARTDTGEAAKRFILLLVDDDSLVLQLLSRVFLPSFDEVLTATNSLDAEILVKTNHITHLVCDHDLGANEPNGLSLIPHFRKTRPEIERAVLFTGSNITRKAVPSSIDRVVVKTADVDELYDAVLAGSRR